MNRPYFQHRPNHIEQQRYFSPHPQHHHHPNPSHILPLPVPFNRDIYHPVHFAPPHLPPPPVPRPFSTPPGGLLYRSTHPHQPQFIPPNRGNGLRQIQHHPRFFSGDSSRVHPAGGSIPSVFNREIYPVRVGRSSSQVVYESDGMDDYGRSQTRPSDQVMRSGNYGSCNSVMSLSCSADNFDPDSDEKVFRRDMRDRFNVKGSCIMRKSGFQGDIDDECEFQEVFNERKRKSHFQESGSYATAAEFREKPFKCFKLPVQSMGKKKSALLRLKVPDLDTIDIDGFENYSNEYHLSSIRGVDSCGSFSGDCGEEGNENDLDVSIKSNVLVAKANITSSNIGVVSDTDLSTKLVKIESPRPTSLISPALALSKHDKSNVQIDSPVCIVSDTTISTQHDMPLESEAGVHGFNTDEMNYSYDKKAVPRAKNFTQMCGKKHAMSSNEEGESSCAKENTDVCHKVCNSVNTAAVVNVHGMGLSIKKPEENGTSTSLAKCQEFNKDLEFVNVNNSSHIFSETSADCVQNIQNGEGFSSIPGSVVPEKTSDSDAKRNDPIFGNLKKTRNFLERSPKTSDHDGCGFFGNKLPCQSDNTMQPEVISPISLAGLYSKSETNSAAAQGMDFISIFNKDYSNKKNLSEELKSIVSTEVSKSSAVLPSDPLPVSKHESAIPTIEFVDCADSVILSNDAHSQFDRSENVFCDSNSNLCLDEHPYEPHSNLEFGNVQPGYSNKTVEVNKNENPVGMSAVCYSEDPHDLLIQPQSYIKGSSELCRNSSGQKNNAVNKFSKHDVYGKSNSRTPRKKTKKKIANNISSSLQKFNRESKLAHKPVNRDPVVLISPKGLPEKCERFSVPKTNTLCSLPITETEITAFSEKHPIKMPILDVQLPMITSGQDCLKLDTCLSYDPNTVIPVRGISVVLGTTQKENTNSVPAEEQHSHINMRCGNEHDALHVISKHCLITEDITNIKQMCSTIDGESVAFVKDDDPSDLNIISLSSNLVVASSFDTDHMPNSTSNVVSPATYGFDLQVPAMQEKKTICEENISKECKPVDDMDLECRSLVSDNDAATHDVKLSCTTFATASDPGIGSSIHSSDEGKQIQGSGISDATNNSVHKMNHAASGISKGTGGNSVSGNFSSKRRLPLGNNGRRHTWHRTGNSSVASKKTNTDILNIQNVSPVISRSQFSYIHKGNSLVRKIGPVIPVQKSYYLKSSKANNSEIDVKDNSGPECIVESMKTTNFPTSKEVDAKYERHNISPADVLDSTCPSEDHILEEDMKLLIIPEAATVMISEDSHKSPLLGEDQVTQNQDEIGVTNMRLPDKDGLIYGKSQPNQFVIATNPSEFPNHNADENNTLALDGYYKSRKNQLIRSADNISKATLSGYSSNPGDQVPSKSISHRSPQKKYSSRIIPRRNKLSDAFRLWTYNRAHTLAKDGFSLKCQAMFSYLFPWKRTYFRKSMHNSDSRSSSLSVISKKLLLTRKRKTIYTKSFDGFSLRKSKVLSVGGSNLKWSKSIERRSRKANECATQAIAEVERKKRQQKSSTHQSYKKLGKNYYSIKSLPLRGERIFRIGSLRYKMDASRRTLQRVEVQQSPLEAEAEKVYIPNRLHIGDDEYVRIGNGNQLIRDPKTRSRVMAKEKIRWSLHTARQRVAKKHMYCQFYTRFGKCKESRKCTYIHDPSKIAVCTKFLRGSCSNSNCKLTHRVIPERMPDCSYFLQGLCSNNECPYRHVNVNRGAPICGGFLRGYCADGDECVKKHNYNCLEFEALGVCAQGSKCKLQHHNSSAKNRKKRKRYAEKSKSGRRYFGSKVCRQKPEQCIDGSSQNGDVFFRNGKLLDYISLDVSSDGEASDDAGEMNEVDENVREVDLDRLIMPIGIM